jgi:hypothetical protein
MGCDTSTSASIGSSGTSTPAGMITSFIFMSPRGVRRCGMADDARTGQVDTEPVPACTLCRTALRAIT